MTNLKAGAVGDGATKFIACMALPTRKGHAASVRRQSRQRLRSERRYRHNRSVRFFGSRYGTAGPSRDCHVGLRPPRNDKPVSLALSAFHFQLSIFHSRLPLPCNSPIRGRRLSKNLSSRKFRREEKCERKPSGFSFAFNHPPQRQNCKIILQNSILQF